MAPRTRSMSASVALPAPIPPPAVTNPSMADTNADTTADDEEDNLIVRLPGELRNHIYRYVLNTNTGSGRQSLAALKLPLLALACRDLWNEVTSTLFADIKLTIAIGTNANLPGEKNRKSAGTLGLSKKLREALSDSKRLGKVALFRNVQLHVYSSDIYVRRARSDYLGATAHDTIRFLLARLELKVVKGKAEANVLVGSNHWGATGINRPKQLDRLLKKAKTTAEKIVSRKGFIGFHVDDIDAIAKELKVKKRRSARSKAVSK